MMSDYGEDTLTQSNANRLRDRIISHWGAYGIDVDVRVEPQALFNGRTSYVIRSNISRICYDPNYGQKREIPFGSSAK